MKLSEEEVKIIFNDESSVAYENILPKGTERIKSIISNLCKSLLKILEDLYKEITGFEMSFEEFKNLCREACKDDFSSHFVDSKKESAKNTVF